MVLRRVGKAPGEASAHHDQVSQMIRSDVTKLMRVGSTPKSGSPDIFVRGDLVGATHVVDGDVGGMSFG